MFLTNFEMVENRINIYVLPQILNDKIVTMYVPMNGGSMPRQCPQKSGQQSDTVRLQNRSQ